MPCYNPEPSYRALENQKIAELIIFVHKKLDIPISPDIEHLAKTAYPDSFELDKNTAYLCGVLNKLKNDDPITFDNIVYDAKCKDSRMLADWWEQHEEFDNNRKK